MDNMTRCLTCPHCVGGLLPSLSPWGAQWMLSLLTHTPAVSYGD